MTKTIEKRPVRSEVPADLTWNLDDLFLSDLEWEAALEEMKLTSRNSQTLKETYILVQNHCLNVLLLRKN